MNVQDKAVLAEAAEALLLEAAAQAAAEMTAHMSGIWVAGSPLGSVDASTLRNAADYCWELGGKAWRRVASEEYYAAELLSAAWNAADAAAWAATYINGQPDRARELARWAVEITEPLDGGGIYGRFLATLEATIAALRSGYGRSGTSC